jgi:hypothetical protein
MKKLDYKIQQILSRNRDGSHATQANRSSILSLCVEQLHEAGYKTNQLNPQDLKGRHIKALVNRWKNDGVSESTMKNRMAALRWLGEKIGNKGLVKPSNDDYGIGKRNYVTNVDKSQNLAKLSEIDKSKLSENVALSLELQQAFGLRREESMKFQAAFALGGHSPQTADKIMIKASWAKGGRYREIPITNDNQRALLEKVALVCGSGSMIPNHKSYKEHKNTFEYESRLAGVGQTHGLRHFYAQNRYKELTGFDCPSVGGVRELSEHEKELDKSVRQIVSNELGHNRLSITGVYLGSWGRKK